MADAAEDLLDEAMKLPDSERRILALLLLDSTGDEPQDDVERDVANRGTTAARRDPRRPRESGPLGRGQAAF